jgi:hypothetical protein
LREAKGTLFEKYFMGALQGLVAAGKTGKILIGGL